MDRIRGEQRGRAIGWLDGARTTVDDQIMPVGNAATTAS